MQESRLQRSYAARLRNREDVRAFCEEKGIPCSTDFDVVTQPTLDTQREFADAYDIPPLPATDLPEKGGSTILVFEQIEKDWENYHGSMVSAVANRVGNNLEPGVETLFVHAGINSHYRKQHQPQLTAPVSELIANQGVPVIHTSIGWDDDHLSFKDGLEEQTDELWKVTAFVVDSAGNNGACDSAGNTNAPFQKHNAVSHSPPLVVHVGAAAKDAQGNWNVEGYSSANSPTFLGRVAPDKKALWNKNLAPEALTGTSIAAPDVSGLLAALNRRYGAYLTREQILYAIIATCDRVDHVNAYAEQIGGKLWQKTPARKALQYVANAAGLHYNPEYAGFGLIRPQKADALLAQMVQLTQANSATITVPVEERKKISIPNIDEQPIDERGNYVYEISMPSGIALKTTLDLEFAEKYGAVSVISPSGTRLPLTMSKRPPAADGKKDLFSLSTTHGWAGEPLEGVWRIESSEPLRQLQMNQHHFMANDIVAQLDVNALLNAPRPMLANARPLTELAHEHAIFWRKNQVQFSGMTIGGAPPDAQSYETLLKQLQSLRSAFVGRTRIYTPEMWGANTQTTAGQLQKAAELAVPIQSKVDHYKHAARIYQQSGAFQQEASMLSNAAQQLLRFIPPFKDNNAPPALEAAALLQQSTAIHLRDGRLDLAYLDCCSRYSALCVALQHFERQGNDARAQQMLVEMLNARTQAKELWAAYLGGADAGAYRIEEGQMGYSSSERIGTDNISQNLTIIARDPVTHKTGLVHLDNHVDVKTLDRFFNGFGQNRLEVRLLGASLAAGETRNNLRRVMQYLTTKDINLLSADILGGAQAPAAVVVDPETFTISERVPTMAHPNAPLANAAHLLARPDKPLAVAFDFTASPALAPVLLSGDALQALRRDILDGSEAQMERYYAKRNFTDRPLVVERMLALREAYVKEWADLSATLEHVIHTQQADNSNAERARQALRSSPIYVGEGAHEANSALREWLKNELLVDGKARYGAMRVVASNMGQEMGFAGRIQQNAAIALR